MSSEEVIELQRTRNQNEKKNHFLFFLFFFLRRKSAKKEFEEQLHAHQHDTTTCTWKKCKSMCIFNASMVL